MVFLDIPRVHMEFLYEMMATQNKKPKSSRHMSNGACSKGSIHVEPGRNCGNGDGHYQI